MPRNRVTVCAGTSWEKATRNADCSGIPPATVVNLGFILVSIHRVPTGIETYHQLSSPVMAYSKAYKKKQSVLGITDTMRRNFANCAELQARSRYLPP